MRPPRALGLMSGTSADGVDAALLELPGWPELGSGAPWPGLPGGVPRGRVLAHVHTPYGPELRARVLAAMRSELDTAALTQLHWELGEVYAAAAAELAADADLIACHGQTVQHHPTIQPQRGWARPATLQLGEAAPIAEATGRPVVADFRPADIAAGGVGAPLVPWADWALFSQPGVRRALLNLGGIANVTLLDGDDPAAVSAYDTGPANCLIDEAAARAGLACDEGGRLAASGRVDDGLLSRWLGHPELRQAPPKATGREVWSLERLGVPGGLSPADLAATATAYTARTVALGLRWLGEPPSEVVVAGGGAHNPVLMDRLRDTLDPIPLRSFADLGWDAAGFTPETREAAAFALLGYARAQGWPNTLPQVTGARRAVSAGKVLAGGAP